MEKYQYRAIHVAVAVVWGKPSKCELCNGKNESKRYEWSNKNHKYSLLKKDWWQLCAKCHRRWDSKKFGKIAWNKGKKGLQKWHNISGIGKKIPWNKDKKENRPEVIEKLKKSHIGKIPWNKGLRYKQNKNR